MHIWSRTFHAAGSRLPDAVEWAEDAARYVAELLGIDISVRQALFGAPVGTLVWNVRFDSLTQYHRSVTRVADDPGFQAFAERSAGLFDAPCEDAFTEVTATNGLDQRAWTFVLADVATQAQPAGALLAADVELCDTVHHLTGCPTLVGRPVFGPRARTMWALGCGDAAVLDRALEALESHSRSPRRSLPVDSHRTAYVDVTGP